MRIGIDISVLNDKQRTGIAVYTFDLIEALLKVNKRDKFILFGIATFETYNFLKNLSFKNNPNVEMRIYRLPARLFRRTFLLWQKLNWPKIEDLIGDVDIFHSFNWYLPPQRYGRVVSTVFDLTPLLFPQFHLEKTVQLDTVRLTRIKERADLTITISESSKKDFLKFSPKSWIEVIYPGVSDNFRVPKDKHKIKEVLNKYHLVPGYFLFVGVIEPRKNVENLMKAFLKSGVDSKLVLVGSRGWKNSQVLDQIIKYPDKVVMTGYVSNEDLSILYNQSLSLVYPSLYEGFGIPVLEAMTASLPVITSKVSSLPEAGGDAAYYIDPLNADEIKRALVEVVRNKSLRKKMIKKGLKQVRKFSWEASAKKLNSLYQQL